MTNPLRDYINLEHREDHSVIHMHGREYYIIDGRMEQDYPRFYGERYDPGMRLTLDLRPVPPKPAPPKGRTWTEAFGLRKPA